MYKYGFLCLAFAVRTCVSPSCVILMCVFENCVTEKVYGILKVFRLPSRITVIIITVTDFLRACR